MYQIDLSFSSWLGMIWIIFVARSHFLHGVDTFFLLPRALCTVRVMSPYCCCSCCLHHLDRFLILQSGVPRVHRASTTKEHTWTVTIWHCLLHSKCQTLHPRHCPSAGPPVCKSPMAGPWSEPTITSHIDSLELNLNPIQCQKIHT